MMNMIMTICYVNCSVHLNTTYFSTCKILTNVNIMNIIIFNQRKYST